MVKGWSTGVLELDLQPRPIIPSLQYSNTPISKFLIERVIC